MPGRDERQTERRDRSGRSQQIEFRGFAIRADGEGGGFDGYASTNWHVDSYLTAFAPGAWAKTLSEQRDRVLVLWQHDPWLPIGRPTEMAEDGTGLKVSARVSEATQAGRDAMALLRDDVPLGLSVGFRTIRERKATEDDPLILDDLQMPEWMKQKGSNPLEWIWVIEEARLYEFSVVSFPANLHAEIETVRSGLRAQELARTLDDLRAGRLDPTARALVADLAAAWQAAPDGQPPAPRTDVPAPRNRHAEFALLWAGIDLSPAELTA
jgi:HK97 family phage prohead protease